MYKLKRSRTNFSFTVENMNATLCISECQYTCGKYLCNCGTNPENNSAFTDSTHYRFQTSHSMQINVDKNLG